MRPTFYDLVTGKTAKDEDQTELSVYWWTEGNGSCDCNRMRFFPEVAEEMEKQQREKHPELHEGAGICFGCKRFIAIDIDGDLTSYDYDDTNPVLHTKEEILREMNSDYPRHSNGCSNHNVLDPIGAYKGVRECGCRKDLFP